ncbi:MAG: alanine/ornithine racemase family PLP-dependent enzyme [Eubacteriales bacterium]|nr:alanine/ornithine racemase family PLP-dependent enzyme [Eubacteriales bacterium]
MKKNRNPYPCLECDLDRLSENLAALIERCHDSNIEVTGVVKAFAAQKEIVRVYERSNVKFIATSRIDQLRAMREAGINKKPLMLIRIPMLSELPDVVALSDISLQSDITVLRATNDEAKKQNKIHDVILMMDLGDLREGFWLAEEAVNAAVEIENELKNLHLAGVGVNLSCYGSVKPARRNMQALVNLAAEIERTIGRQLEWVSGGASTSMYMALGGMMPYRINMLRIGEFGLLGGIYGCYPDFMHRDVFTLKAEVIECRDKPSHPIGELEVDAFGRTRTYEDRGIRRRALLAVGRMDYGDPADIIPRRKGVEVLGASSDHTILDVEDVKDEIKVGDVLEFDVTYGALAYLSSADSVCVTTKGGNS